VALVLAQATTSFGLMTRRVLIYSPELVGHPRIYCRVIADALQDQDCEVSLAIGTTEQAGLHNSPDLQPLIGRSGCSFIETRTRSAAGSPFLSAEELVSLQRETAANVTLFIEADKSNDEFNRIAEGAAPRLVGRNIGIFAKTAEWYPGEDSFTGQRKRLVAPTVRTTLGNVKRATFARKQHPRYFYEHTIIGKRVLDVFITKDERLADFRGAPALWMPEISRPKKSLAPGPIPDAEGNISHALRAFVERSGGRELILYFGDAAYYKGYDLFLEYVARNPDMAAVHAGQLYDQVQLGYFQYDVARRRSQLAGERRLFETCCYIASDVLKELLFSSIRFFVSTHRLALSSSTMLQAVEQGKPLIVPDRGLLQHRVKVNRLGETYRYEDLDDLDRAVRRMQSQDLRQFGPDIERFWSQFSDSAVESYWRRVLLTP